jgi:hypothetical protein
MGVYTATVAFYLGVAAAAYGTIRVTRASIEHRRRDVLGLAALLAGIALLAASVIVHLRDPAQILVV